MSGPRVIPSDENGVQYITISLDSAYGFPFNLPAEHKMLVGEAERFAAELKKAIDAARIAMRPKPSGFWNNP